MQHRLLYFCNQLSFFS